MEVLDAILRRRSVKRFTDRPVSGETIDRLLELAVAAPNHRHTEPWRFVVLGPEARRTYARLKGEERASRVEDPDAAEAVRRKMAESLGSVPAVLGFVQRLDDDPEIREEDFASVYMGIQNVLLGAVSLGLATHVKTGALLDAPETRTALDVSEGERLVALVHLGEPATEPDPPRREPGQARTRRLP